MHRSHKTDLKLTLACLPGKEGLHCPSCDKSFATTEELVVHQIDSHMERGYHPDVASALGRNTKKKRVANTAALVTSRAFHRRLTEKVRYQLQGLIEINDCRF